MSIAEPFYPIEDGFEKDESIDPRVLMERAAALKKDANPNVKKGVDNISEKLDKVLKNLDEVNKKLDIILSALGYK